MSAEVTYDRRGGGPAAAPPTPAVAPTEMNRWKLAYAQALVAIDGAAITLAGAIALLPGISFAPVDAYSLMVIPVWMTMLAASRTYEERFVAVGPEEFRRV